MILAGCYSHTTHIVIQVGCCSHTTHIVIRTGCYSHTTHIVIQAGHTGSQLGHDPAMTTGHVLGGPSLHATATPHTSSYRPDTRAASQAVTHP